MYDSTHQVRNADFSPRLPRTLEDTELDFRFLADLALKIVSMDANCTAVRVAEKLSMPVHLTETLLQHLYHEKFVEIHGTEGFQNYRYAMLERGWQQVNRLLALNGYIGPAPVSLRAYSEMVTQQNKTRESVTQESMTSALSGLVLPKGVLQTLGLVANSRRSLFMYGESGNGKTSTATAIHSAQPGEIWIPYSIEVDGQIIKVFDPYIHLPVENHNNSYDRRWIKIKRPLVIVGGEMTIETMDLVYSRSVRYYEAPFQMKANGGTLVIDDFGRQRVDPMDLLNRWIIPLERQTDYLTLHTGKKIEVPFEQLLIFSTNLDLKGLVDDAFLRRMGYRLYLGPPDQERYGNIFRTIVNSNRLEYDPELLDFLLLKYEEEQRPLRCCEPRDLLQRCIDICRYENQSASLSKKLLELAWNNYFGTGKPV
jgi:predicted ATPase with chaperone activity